MSHYLWLRRLPGERWREGVEPAFPLGFPLSGVALSKVGAVDHFSVGANTVTAAAMAAQSLTQIAADSIDLDADFSDGGLQPLLAHLQFLRPERALNCLVDVDCLGRFLRRTRVPLRTHW
jgi:hypothetical protein